jgi:DNA-binding LacI/PurR family transcriptional regulator
MTPKQARSQGRPTLELVAAAAGVSRSTVSRVVNGSPNVTDEAVAAVQSAIEALGYVPNRAARMLAGRRAHAIALVIPENTAKFFADPFFAAVIQGVAQYLSTTEYSLTLLIAADADAKKTRYYLQSGNVDGALVLSHHIDDHSYSNLSQEIPLVFGGRPTSYGGTMPHYVDVDNVAAARGATERLVASGRKRIGTIAGPQNMAVGIDRLEGWRQALRAHGIDDGVAEIGDFSPASGEAAMQRLLAREGAQFDGLFIANAQMASGALSVLREHGIKVPRDVGIITVDDDYFALSAKPPLTTVAQPTTEVGEKMAEVLLDLMAGKDVPRVTELPTRIVERASL